MIWFVITVLIMCTFILLRSRLWITVECQIKNKCFELKWSVSVYRIRIVHKTDIHHLSQEDEHGKRCTRNGDLSLLIERLPKLRKKWLPTLSDTRIQTLDWQTHIGVGEAHSTAIVTGGLWSIKSMLVSFLSQHTECFIEPSLHITPYFNTYTLETHLFCMVSINMGKAIISIFKS